MEAVVTRSRVGGLGIGVAVVVLVLAVWAPSGWTNIDEADDEVLFNVTAFGFVSEVLRERGEEIDAVLECLPLWKVAAREVPDSAGARYHVRLEFGFSERRTSRIYRLSYLVERDASGYEIVGRETGYGSLSLDKVQPDLSVPDCRAVLGGVLLDGEFTDAVAQWMSDGGTLIPIRQYTVEELPERAGGVEVFRLGLHRRGYAGRPGTESRYWEVSGDWAGGFEIIPEGDR